MISSAYSAWTPDVALRERVAARVVVHEGDEWQPWVEGGRVHVPRNWWTFERWSLLEESLPNQQPGYSSSVVPYTAIPFSLRVQLNRLRIAVLRRGAADVGFPLDPVETRLDALRAEIWRMACELEGVQFAPTECKRLVLTHDLDEGAGWDGVALLRDVERDLELPSAFGILSKRYTLTQGQLGPLVDEGCEIFSHGYLHDGTLAFLPIDELRHRLGHFFTAYPFLRDHTRGFRAGQLVRSPQMFDIVAEYFEYDMTPPTVELGGPHGWRTGCGTTIPFTRDNGLVHIPLTLPQDYFLSFIDGHPAQVIADRWADAARRVWAVGGTAVHLVHPDNVLRRPGLLQAYRMFLEAMLSEGAEVLLPGDVMTSLGVNR